MTTKKALVSFLRKLARVLITPSSRIGLFESFFLTEALEGDAFLNWGGWGVKGAGRTPYRVGIPGMGDSRSISKIRKITLKIKVQEKTKSLQKIFEIFEIFLNYTFIIFYKKSRMPNS